MKSAEDMYHEIKALADDDEFKLKTEKLESLLQVHPDYAPAHDELGAIFYKTENYAEALKHFEEAATLVPNNIRYLKNLGDFYYTVLSRREDALNCYQKVLEMAPLDSEANFVAANMLVSMHRFDEAEQLYLKVLSLEPWRLDVQEVIDKLKNHEKETDIDTNDDRYQKAQILAKENDINGAINILKEIVTDDPEFAVGYNDLGVLYYQNGNLKEAQINYEKAVKLDQNNIIFKKNLAEYYLFVKKDIEKALELYLTILKDHPYDIETLMAAGKISENYSRIDDAKVFYEAILDIEPWNLEASDRLSELDLENSKPQNKISFS